MGGGHALFWHGRLKMRQKIGVRRQRQHTLVLWEMNLPMKGYEKYYKKKIIWFFITLVAALILNFCLPRLMPGDPVASITAKTAQGISDTAAVRAIYENYAREFGTNRPIIEQFFIYVGNLLHGNFGLSFSQYPRPVSDIIRNALPWTIALQFPAILVGWLIGNILGALAAYIRKGFDKVLLPAALFLSGIPAFGMAVFLLTIFGINLKIAPIAGGYGSDLIPSLNFTFIQSVFRHYQLPFWSLVIIAIGWQATGMRSMALYELNADYVKYSRYMGIKDSKIVRYVFRNAILPQITGLALSIGTMLGGGLVVETIFSYPGLGTIMLQAISKNDYPLISAITLIITIMVLCATFIMDILYGLIDPRVKAAQAE